MIKLKTRAFREYIRDGIEKARSTTDSKVHSYTRVYKLKSSPLQKLNSITTQAMKAAGYTSLHLQSSFHPSQKEIRLPVCEQHQYIVDRFRVKETCIHTYTRYEYRYLPSVTKTKIDAGLVFEALHV